MRIVSTLGRLSLPCLLCALALGAFVPGIVGCKKKPKKEGFSVAEAEHNLKKIFDGAKAYYEMGEMVDRRGNVLPSQFPGTMPFYPATKCCTQKDKLCQPVEGKGGFRLQPSLTAVGFEIADPHAFQYRLISSGTREGAKLTIQAVADPNCDGKHVVLELKATVDKERRVKAGKVEIRRDVTKLD